jgi:large subunit ribosomal protein L16|tara:strand:+ start:2132 stop:2533 length:402 start_codon:yes stop_codon:yes gene_type:complete
MLRPRQTKFRKVKKGRIRGIETRSTDTRFGSFGLRAIESGRITARQIESARRVITRRMNRRGKVWIKIFPSMPVTSKPVEVRMGKGKGAVDYWVCPVRKGTLLYEVGGVSREIALQALHGAATKLPVATKVIF